MNILTIILLVIAIVVMLAGSIVFIKGKKQFDAKQRDSGFLYVFFSFLLAVLAYFSIPMTQTLDKVSEHEEMINEIEENADDWVFYLDGEEVSFDTVDIRQYRVSYDMETHKVFLTNKTNGKSIFMPIFIPH